MKPLPPTYGEALLTKLYGYTGSFHSSHIHSFVPIYEIKELNPALDKRLVEAVLQNIRSVLDENPEDIEFDLYTPLCDTAIYYFVEDVEEYDDSSYFNDLHYDKNNTGKFELMSTEDLSYDIDDEEDEDCVTDEGLNFWEHCAMIGIGLRPIDCLMEG